MSDLPLPCPLAPLGDVVDGEKRQADDKPAEQQAPQKAVRGNQQRDKGSLKVGKEGGAGDEEVEAGARRLGELVREREQAKLRAEMEELRKEIQELKV